MPIIGFGLLYTHGYFRQSSTRPAGSRSTTRCDPNELPVEMLRRRREPVTITLTINHRPVVAQLWVAQVGRVPLLFMDAQMLDANDEAARSITDRSLRRQCRPRLAQEILLRGGRRASPSRVLPRYGPSRSMYHCNEGHAGFLRLERIREYMTSGDDFDTAWEKTRAGNVFTTHTSARGIGRFGNEQVTNEFGDFTPAHRSRPGTGRWGYAGGDPSRFNMAVMGLRLGEHANGVSRLHGKVSREMFQGLWPDFDVSEVPIGSVTNGVHAQAGSIPTCWAPAGTDRRLRDGG